LSLGKRDCFPDSDTRVVALDDGEGKGDAVKFDFCGVSHAHDLIFPQMTSTVFDVPVSSHVSELNDTADTTVSVPVNQQSQSHGSHGPVGVSVNVPGAAEQAPTLPSFMTKEEQQPPATL
jgi:hypothetical protein